MTSDTAQTVVFVEDDEPLRRATTQALELAGFSVRSFAGAEQALAVISARLDGVVVSDIRMPRMDGLQLLRAIREIDGDLPVILVTGHGDVPMAVSALHDGAFDFLTKPFSTDHLIAAINRALERRGLLIENRRLKATIAASEGDGPMIGQCDAMAEVKATIRQLAQADVDVLIEGESGTGKELGALLLHRLGPRRARPFIAVNCAALPPDTAAIELFGHAANAVPHTRTSRTGQIATANGGTLLLDDIDTLAPAVQTALLRVIEEREVQPIGAERADAVNLRVVATSRIDLAEAAAAGRFREDLYHRLAVTRLRLPPVRERDQDRMLLFAFFAEQACAQFARADYTMTDLERSRLLMHHWPGNVRELRNYAFERVLAFHGATGGGDEQDLASRVAEFEITVITDALRATRGSVTRAMDVLKIPRKTLYYKMTRYGIDPDVFRSQARQDGGTFTAGPNR
ncbi:sigma-54-dependent transcriptional regulator [Sphingomonas insulae]|nr:sigma-54 dependent transcriptional regulator [Sphingomonas insulae]